MIRVWLGRRFRREAGKLSAADQAMVAAALEQLPEAFGNVHVHAGLGIRRLGGNWFECRAGLRLRILFRMRDEAAECYTVGDHDHIRRTLRAS